LHVKEGEFGGKEAKEDASPEGEQISAQSRYHIEPRDLEKSLETTRDTEQVFLEKNGTISYLEQIHPESLEKSSENHMETQPSGLDFQQTQQDEVQQQEVQKQQNETQQQPESQNIPVIDLEISSHRLSLSNDELEYDEFQSLSPNSRAHNFPQAISSELKVEENDGVIYERVERIIGRRYRGTTLQYKLKWYNKPWGEASWVCKDNMINCDNFIQKFETKYRQRIQEKKQSEEASKRFGSQ